MKKLWDNICSNVLPLAFLGVAVYKDSSTYTSLLVLVLIGLSAKWMFERWC